MKKILLFASALAGLFFAASCQQENLEPVGGNTVTYTVQVPDALATKALGDDVSNVNIVHYEVYRTAEANTVEFTGTDNLLYHKTAPMTAGTATINLELVNDQNYTVLFWAQVGEENEAYDVDDLTNVTVKTDLYANKVDYAAFAGRDFIVEGKNLAGRTVTLTRPISQINIATTPESLEGNGAFIDDVVLEGSSVTVAGLSNTFDVANLAASAQMNSTYEFAENTVPTETLEVNGKNYTYVAMNYVGFAEALGTQVTVSYVINTTEGNIDNEIKNVPVKPNYRTNIVGNLITSTSDYTITLEDKWAGVADEMEIWDGKFISAPAKNDAGVYEVTKPSELAWLAAAVNGTIETRATEPAKNFAGETFVLTENIDLGNFPWTPIGLTGDAAGFQGTFDGNGKTISNLYVDLTAERKYQSAGLFGSARDGVIKDLTINNATVKSLDDAGNTSNGIGVVVGSAQFGLTIENVTVKNVAVEGNRRVAGIAGYFRGTITGCTIDNAIITATPDLLATGKYDNGDKVGGLIGYANGKVVLTGNTVKNFTVKGYRDAGGVAGYATDSNNNISGNTVIDGSVILDRNYDYCEVKGMTAGAVLGYGTPGENTVTNVAVANTEESIDSNEAFAAALSDVADGGVIPVSGEIAVGSFNAAGKNITIVGTTDDAVVDAEAQKDATTTSGNITFKNLTFKLSSSNNHYDSGFDADNGTLTFENCKFEGITTSDGNFVFNNCQFTNTTTGKYAAWVYNGKTVYNNCTFIGVDRAAKVFNENAYSNLTATYNNCTFKSSTANKTAVEVDVTNNTAVATYVEIINPTVENMGVAEHYAVGAAGVCNLETSGVGLGIVNVDGKGYSVAHTAAQLQALTNAGKDVTIQFAQDIAGDFTYEQNNGEHIVIDGTEKTYNGTISIKARGDKDNPNSLLIKNINFKTTAAAEIFIHSVETNYYPNNVTVSNCTFEGTGADSSVLPVDIKSANKFVMENCTATKVHSLVQNTSGWNITIRNCEVTESGRGIALGTVQGATIENVKIDALDTKYGIRMDAGYNNNATIKDCEISAFIPVVVRKASVNSTVVFNGTNTMTPANTDGLWCAIGTSEYEANGVMPTDPTAQVTITLNDAGLDPAGVYGAANL
ncbi:MAG: right-handed parallel beta-helix repeat-containing protein [Bacteroidales bacterium]|nr:right-handed parallel beta-helix repeat-containing protein [Bacteroidales bacterium]